MSKKFDRFDIGCYLSPFRGVGVNERGSLAPDFQRNGQDALWTDVAKSPEESLVL
jgi:hypothetical protein